MNKRLPIYVLPNGIRVVVDVLKSVETVSLGMFIKAGSRDDKIGKSGTAHLLEHMIFKGCKNKQGQNVIRTLEDVGGQANAYTTKELTAFHFKVLKQDFNLALKLLANMLMESKFEEVEFENEKKVILQEIAQDNEDLDSLFNNLMTEIAYTNQDLGRPVLGTSDSVKNMKVKDLYDFMKDNYASDECVLSVSGNVDEKKILDLILKLFSPWPYRKNKISKKAKYIGGKRIIENKLGNGQVYFYASYPAPSYDNIKEVYTAKLLKIALTGGIFARLYQELREKRGLVYGIKSTYINYTDNGIFSIFSSVATEKFNEFLKVLLNELKLFGKNIMKDDELNKIKAQIRAGISFEMEGTSARIMRNAYQIIFYHDLYPVKNILDLIDSITAKDIAAMAKRVFDNGAKPTILVYGNVEVNI